MTEVYLYYNVTQHCGLYGAVATTIEWPYYGGSTVLGITFHNTLLALMRPPILSY